MAYGILVASYNVEDFSLDRLMQIERSDLDLRMERYRKMLSSNRSGCLPHRPLFFPSWSSWCPR